MDGMYILKTFTSWYSIGLNQFSGSQTNRSDADLPRDEVFDDLKAYTDNNAPKELWIDRSTCQITESALSLAGDEPVSEMVVDAFLGIVEVLNTYHLGVVLKSETVAELDLGEVSFNKNGPSKIMMVKEVKFLPIQSELENLYVINSANQDEMANTINSPNFGNLTNIATLGGGLSMNFPGNPDQIHLQLEVQKIIENMEKILSTGYYYSYDTDLTNTLQNLYLDDKVPFRKMLKNSEAEVERIEEIMERNKALYKITNYNFNWCHKITNNVPKSWTVVMIQGHIGHSVLKLKQDRVEFLLIGRRNIKRSGTRYVARGIDEEGNVGNFVESELRMRVNDEKWLSFVQNRGSVPIFWEQLNFTAPVNLYNHHLNFRSFSKHMDVLREFYKPCQNYLFINLLDVKENEKILSDTYMELVDQYNMANSSGVGKGKDKSPLLNLDSQPVSEDEKSEAPTKVDSGNRSNKIELVNYNYNVNAKWNTHDVLINYILGNLSRNLREIGYFDVERFLENRHEKDRHESKKEMSTVWEEKEGLQKGIIRTNCLDCLDRTNIFQWILGWMVFNNMMSNRKGGLEEMKMRAEGSEDEQMAGRGAEAEQERRMEEQKLFSSYTDLWCSHGDLISIHYSGTPSTLSERVRQNNTNINSLLYYSKMMVQRVYNSIFQDYQRQAIFNILTPASYAYKERDFANEEQGGYDRGEEAMTARMFEGETVSRKLSSARYNIQNVFPEGQARKEVERDEKSSQGRSEAMSEDVGDSKSVEGSRVGPARTKREDDSILDKLNSELSKLLTLSKSSLFVNPSSIAESFKPKEELVEVLAEPEVVEESLEGVKEVVGNDLKIWVGSWNIGAHMIKVDEDLLKWTEMSKIHCDIYIFSFQEFVELNLINIATGKTDQNKENEFEDLIVNMFKFSTDQKYYKLSSISMTGLYLVVFVKESLRPHIDNVLMTNVKTGLNYNMGNKGCVGVQFKLFEYNMSFLNVHLNFGKNLNVGRIALIEYILKNSFNDSTTNVMSNDIFVMGGDFNFQIQLEKEVVLDMLKKKEFRKLFNYDEFNMAKMIGIPILNRLYEPEIRFLPTYKYRDGTRFYTTKRAPAWCDRIIFGGKLLENNKIEVLNYKRNDNLILSDHRPISSIMLLKLK